MSKAVKMVAASLIGADFVNITVNGRVYSIFPPTIEKLAGAGMYITDFSEASTFSEIIKSISDSQKLASALSWLIKGDESLYNELSKGTLDEIVDGICQAYSLISVENFSKLSVLARNVSRLIANPK